jgi:protein CpxP
MKTKKLILLTALATGCLLTLNVSAQDKPQRPEGARPPGAEQGGQRRGNIAEQLNLTAEQKPKVEVIMKEAGEKRRALREDTSLTPEQKREKGQAIQQATTAKMKEVLTAEQFAKFEELTKNRRGQGPGGPGGQRPQGERPAKNAP